MKLENGGKCLQNESKFQQYIVLSNLEGITGYVLSLAS